MINKRTNRLNKFLDKLIIDLQNTKEKYNKENNFWNVREYEEKVKSMLIDYKNKHIENNIYTL